MSLASFFGFRSITDTVSEFPEIFPLSVTLKSFVDADVLNVYSKILTDCIERTHGIPDKVEPLLWDNCLQSESTQGLITLLAKAMTDQKELFLVYKSNLNVLRVANETEATMIKADYAKQGKSPIGIFASFKNYHRTDMVKIYSSMEYNVVASLNKMTNLSKAIQFKMSDMRSSISLTDSSVAKDQAKSLAISLSRGRDILLDKNDEISTNAPDISSIKESIAFLDAKRCFYYGMPLSYVNGEQTAGIGSTGEADTKAVERGLRQYYISILKPVLEALFDANTSFKSNDFRQIESALDALKTFELSTGDLLSRDDQKIIISKLFDLETNE